MEHKKTTKLKAHSLMNKYLTVIHQIPKHQMNTNLQIQQFHSRNYTIRVVMKV